MCTYKLSDNRALIFNTDYGMFLIDTTIKDSIGNTNQICCDKKLIYISQDPQKLQMYNDYYAGANLNAVLGLDILKSYILLIDVQQQNITFFQNIKDIKGYTIKTSSD